MQYASAKDVELAYEETGSGEPLVLVHGGWSDHHNWAPVIPGLAESFRVVAYDRRGHGRSQRPFDQGTRRDQEDDLAALIEELGHAPAHVAGTSFGGSIALGLAARRPELIRSVVAHEPPLMSIVADDPEIQPLMAGVVETLGSVLLRVAEGDEEGAARQFAEEVALGPGSWEQLPESIRQTMIGSAAAFLAEQRDPSWASIDPAEVSDLGRPVLLTQGTDSPPWFPKIVAGLAEGVEHADVRTYRGAGHAPHLTHPQNYLRTITEFLTRTQEPALTA